VGEVIEHEQTYGESSSTMTLVVIANGKRGEGSEAKEKILTTVIPLNLKEAAARKAEASLGGQKTQKATQGKSRRLSEGGQKHKPTSGGKRHSTFGRKNSLEAQGKKSRRAPLRRPKTPRKSLRGVRELEFRQRSSSPTEVRGDDEWGHKKEEAISSWRRKAKAPSRKGFWRGGEMGRTGLA